MASKKKLIKGIKTIEKRIKEHEKKLAEAFSEEGKNYLIKDLNRLKWQKEKKEKQL
ncbi:hypothetical protein KKG83_08145 [Candidatus Micrarchaeota archaeon]|nr:hypothetical protein [Candidatus Micrarchaeota archaeon]